MKNILYILEIRNFFNNFVPWMINLFTMKFFQFFFNAVIDSAPNAVFTVNNLKSENKN